MKAPLPCRRRTFGHSFAAGVYLVGRFYLRFHATVSCSSAPISARSPWFWRHDRITQPISNATGVSTVSHLGNGSARRGWLVGRHDPSSRTRFHRPAVHLLVPRMIHACHTNEMRAGWPAPPRSIDRVHDAGGLPGIAAPEPVRDRSRLLLEYIRSSPGLSSLTRTPRPPSCLRGSGGAAVTAFYMFRLGTLTFAARPRHHVYDHAHEAPWGELFAHFSAGLLPPRSPGSCGPI